MTYLVECMPSLHAVPVSIPARAEVQNACCPSPWRLKWEGQRFTVIVYCRERRRKAARAM